MVSFPLRLLNQDDARRRHYYYLQRPRPLWFGFPFLSTGTPRVRTRFSLNRNGSTSAFTSEGAGMKSKLPTTMERGAAHASELVKDYKHHRNHSTSEGRHLDVESFSSDTPNHLSKPPTSHDDAVLPDKPFANHADRWRLSMTLPMSASRNYSIVYKRQGLRLNCHQLHENMKSFAKNHIKTAP